MYEKPLDIEKFLLKRLLLGFFSSQFHFVYFTDQHQQSSTYHMALHDWMEERRNKVFKQPTKLDIEMDRDTNIKTVLSNIKKNASYGSGSSGSNS